MKTKITAYVFSLVALMLSAACTSLPDAKPAPWSEAAASIVQPITQGAVPLVLNKNPSLAPALETLAGAVPAAFGAGELSPEAVAKAVADLDARLELKLGPDVDTLLANGISIAVSQYKQRAGLGVATATDPNVKLLLTAFSQGLHDGVASWKAGHPSS